jgi:hypothetical protein
MLPNSFLPQMAPGYIRGCDLQVESNGQNHQLGHGAGRAHYPVVSDGTSLRPAHQKK